MYVWGMVMGEGQCIGMAIGNGGSGQYNGGVVWEWASAGGGTSTAGLSSKWLQGMGEKSVW